MSTQHVVAGVAHVGIPVRDIEQSLRFYRDVLGLPVIVRGRGGGDRVAAGVGVPGADIETATLDAGNTEIELLQYHEPEGAPFELGNNDAGATHVNFEVADVRATYEHLQERGVPCNTPPIASGDRAGWGWFYARDPDGIPVEFFGPLST